MKSFLCLFIQMNSTLNCTRCRYQLVFWIRYAGRRPSYALISIEVTSAASVLLLSMMLCSSAKLLTPLARVQHWRTHRRSRVQVFKRSRAYKGARERTSARESRSAQALDYLLYPSFSRPRSPTLPRTFGEPWAERVHCGRFAVTAEGDLPRWKKQIWDFHNWTCRPVRRYCEAAYPGECENGWVVRLHIFATRT